MTCHFSSFTSVEVWHHAKMALIDCPRRLATERGGRQLLDDLEAMPGIQVDVCVEQGRWGRGGLHDARSTGELGVPCSVHSRIHLHGVP